MAKTKGQLNISDEFKKGVDKTLIRRTIKKDAKGFDGVVMARRLSKKRKK